MKIHVEIVPMKPGVWEVQGKVESNSARFTVTSTCYIRWADGVGRMKCTGISIIYWGEAHRIKIGPRFRPTSSRFTQLAVLIHYEYCRTFKHALKLLIGDRDAPGSLAWLVGIPARRPTHITPSQTNQWL